MNGQPRKIVEELEAAKATLHALEEALARTQEMIVRTRKIIDEAKVTGMDDESAGDGKLGRKGTGLRNRP
jgi:hypothetical protein